MLVGFGQTICRPVGPKCSECIASDLCPTGKLILQEGHKEEDGNKKVKKEKKVKQERSKTKKRRNNYARKENGKEG